MLPVLLLAASPLAATAAGRDSRAHVASARALTPQQQKTNVESRAQRVERAPAAAPTPTPAPAPTPVAATPPPAPPAAPSPLRFFSDFSQGLQNWSTAGVGDVIPQVVQSAEGPYCEFTLTGTQGRSELIMGDSLHIVEGETVLYEFEEFIVPGFAYGSRSLGWNLFTQFKSDGEGSPMLGLDLWNDGGKKGLWVETDTGHGVYYAAPMAEGVWHRVAMRITASSQGRGAWNIYLDGQEVDSKSGVSTIRPGKGFAYIKNGLYRSGPTINATGKLRMRNASLLALG